MTTIPLAILIASTLLATSSAPAAEEDLRQTYLDQAAATVAFLDGLNPVLDACYQALVQRGLDGMENADCQRVFAVAANHEISTRTEPLLRVLARLRADEAVLPDPRMEAALGAVSAAVKANTIRTGLVNNKLRALTREAEARRAARGN